MMMVERRCTHLQPWILVCAAVILLLGSSDSHAGKSVYSYVDEHGKVVATDRWEDIPARYRTQAKVGEHAGGKTAPREREALPLVSKSVSGEVMLYEIIHRLPPTVIPGLSTYQSVILIGGFLAMGLLYGSGKLTGSPFLRLLMPWAIGFMAVATVYFMFVSELSNKVAARYPAKSTGSLVHQFQGKGQDLSEQKQHRLKEFNQRSDQN